MLSRFKDSDYPFGTFKLFLLRETFMVFFKSKSIAIWQICDVYDTSNNMTVSYLYYF